MSESTLKPQALPKLRAVDATPIVQSGRPAVLLRDPLRLSTKNVLLPQPLAPLLILCDGTRDTDALRASLMVRYGVRVSIQVIEQVISALDDACLLANEHFEHARRQALDAYREAPHRRPVVAGLSYPDEPRALVEYLDALLDGVDDADVVADPMGQGLISPHIDYQRGGQVYARVWGRAAELVRSADVALVLGTDHAGDGGTLTLTRQSYATPVGVLETDRGIVDRIAQSLGELPDACDVFRDELHHSVEHSIELALVWLLHMRGGKSCPVVPVLCGSFAPYVSGEQDPAEDPRIERLVETWRHSTAGRRAIVIAAGDLAHVGPAFQGQPSDAMGRARVRAADMEMIAHIEAGDARAFHLSVRRSRDKYNVCGVPPIYIALRALNGVGGHCVAYDMCPADSKGTSLVSVCGVIFGADGVETGKRTRTSAQ